MDHNSFTNFTWANAYQTGSQVATGNLNTWTIFAPTISLNNNPNNIFQVYRNNIYFGNNNTGKFLVNCSFNSDGATNDNLGFKILYSYSGTVIENSICKWNSKGGNTWSVNHSVVIDVDQARFEDPAFKFGELLIYTTNFTDSANFNISNLNINIMRLL